MTEVEVRVPGELEPSTDVVLSARHVGGDQETLVLGEDVCCPVGVDGIGAVNEAVGDSATFR